ncbi:MAG: glutaminase [Deltaproteobacteria bacterium]|nr:MAG: glutaminase [Deltaproteobacteria bacterium]
MNWEQLLQRVYDDVAPSLGEGKVADYIPALACADPHAFALSVATLDGAHYGVGLTRTSFSIQSISKVFALKMALSLEGVELWQRVGREPSGTPFNSIVQLEREGGVPRNPFINAGALIVTDALVTRCGQVDAVSRLIALLHQLSGSSRVACDPEVAASERTWGDRNRSLAYFMRSFGVLKNAPEIVLDAYFRQCSITMTTHELAQAGLFLANDGVDPLHGGRVAAHSEVNRINALMLTCGHYDMSGDFAWRVGLPGKSGVGGGILAIVPGLASVAVWSPALNAAGNSLVGTLALERLSERGGLNLF